MTSGPMPSSTCSFSRAARVGDLVALELGDLMLGERSGTVVYRHGKGNKQRSVPLPLPARRALQCYLETRPPVQTPWSLSANEVRSPTEAFGTCAASTPP